jgi:pantetheine-phosphate adenylyltransferase
MEPVYVYPGTFGPPTYGHLEVVKNAAKLFREVIILCSVNPEKSGLWFTPEEASALWSGYHLPPNARVMTYDEFSSAKIAPERIIMIRGIRDEADAEAEGKVMLYNLAKFKIRQFYYFCSSLEFKDVSSSKARELAERLELSELAKYVAPLVISALIEKCLGIRNLFLVVGRPGSGKSTFLNMLGEIDVRNVHLNTDLFAEELKPLIAARFGGEDLVQIALTREAELKELIGAAWIERLKRALRAVPKGANIFLEAAFGLQPDKSFFRLVGGKVVYVGCDEAKNRERIMARGTPEHLPFVERIPGWDESLGIGIENRLQLTRINTDNSPEELMKIAEELNCRLNTGGAIWKDYSLA